MIWFMLTSQSFDLKYRKLIDLQRFNQSGSVSNWAVVFHTVFSLLEYLQVIAATEW